MNLSICIIAGTNIVTLLFVHVHDTIDVQKGW